ncbi:MAG: GatB/YqeY domain-containing protein [Actinomycetia bacterium]|nr:GatB/YqeY domain-containing protein [Actinomycetes bacterium]
MIIAEQLKQDQIAAMRSRDKATLNAIRSIQAEVATAKAAPGFSGEVDDDLYVRTIATYVKRITKSRTEYEAIGERGAEQVGLLTFEIDYLDRYLPRTLDEAATRTLVIAAMADVGADENTPAGKVIGAVMRSGESVDGALVNKIVQEELGS